MFLFGKKTAREPDLIAAKKYVAGEQGLWVWSVLPPAMNARTPNHGEGKTRLEADRAADSYIEMAYGHKLGRA